MSDISNTIDDREIRERIALIEAMMNEGRKKTEAWGWSFVLWGVAYYIAIAWSSLGHSNWAWPVTMVATALLTAIIPGRRRRRSGVDTALGRAINSIWIGVGSGLFIICFGLAVSGHSEQHAFLATVEVMLGAAYVTSALILRWRAQFAAGIAWWIAAIVTCFVATEQTGYIFLGAIFLCNIVFGLYMMANEAQDQKARAARSGASHA